jgi:hypothetical protein
VKVRALSNSGPGPDGNRKLQSLSVQPYVANCPGGSWPAGAQAGAESRRLDRIRTGRPVHTIRNTHSMSTGLTCFLTHLRNTCQVSGRHRSFSNMNRNGVAATEKSIPPCGRAFTPASALRTAPSVDIASCRPAPENSYVDMSFCRAIKYYCMLSNYTGGNVSPPRNRYKR